MTWRLAHNPLMGGFYDGLVSDRRWTGRTKYDAGWWHKLAAMKKGKRVFFNGMGDLFHENNNGQDIIDCLQKIRQCSQHIFITPTKRPHIAANILKALCEKVPNLILLASVENQEQADKRVPALLRCAPYVKAVGLSAEPLIGPLDISGWVVNYNPGAYHDIWKKRSDIGWIVCGGETGPGARPVHPAWVRALRDQCAEARVSFMFKSWGEWSEEGPLNHPIMMSMTDDGKTYMPGETAYPNGPRYGEAIRADFPNHNPIIVRRIGKSRAGRLLDGREYNEVI